MTNNPTIDGVSRELRHLLERIVRGGDILDSSEAMYELRALLDAPVVERQPDAEVVDINGFPIIEWCATDYPAGTKLYMTTPEVASLQSTIAQLQARVQELESGRGEPVAWLTRCIKGVREGVVEEVDGPDDVENTEYWTPTFPVFTAPPAQVAVLSDEKILEAMRPAIYRADGGYVFDTAKGDVLEAGRALIAALNGERK